MAAFNVRPMERGKQGLVTAQDKSNNRERLTIMPCKGVVSTDSDICVEFPPRGAYLTHISRAGPLSSSFVSKILSCFEK